MQNPSQQVPVPLRRISSRELVDRSLDFDIDLTPLECSEQIGDEPLFNEFKFIHDFEHHTKQGRAEFAKRKFDLNDPSVHQLNLNLPARLH